MENVHAINVDQPSAKSKGESGAPLLRRPPTRGFIRAQKKRARLLEMIPDNALIVAMDLARARHCIGMSTVKKEPLDRWKISKTLC